MPSLSLPPFPSPSLSPPVSDCFLKLNQAPYLLMLDLFAAVDLESAACTIDRDAQLILLVLRKSQAAAWPELQHTASSASELSERRAASSARRMEHEEQVRQRQKALCVALISGAHCLSLSLSLSPSLSLSLVCAHNSPPLLCCR